MIRRSGYAALAAIVLSLLLHALGLGFTSSEDRSPSTEDTASDLADVGDAFEDFAEAISGSAEPEPASVPDPPDVTSPEQVILDTPTTQALVASDNPQNVLVPDTGVVDVVQPDPVEPSGVDAPAPETAPDSAAPSGSQDDRIADAPVLTPLEPDTEADAPEGAQVENPVPAEPMAGEVAPVSSAETVLPVAPAPSPDVAIIPAPEVQQADVPDIALAPEPDEPETLTAMDSEEQSSPAVTTSLRPPKERPSVAVSGLSDGARPGRATRTIESPLTTYKRTGIDPFAAGSGAARSGTTGFSGSRNPGNASTTNYAGQVLVQLNRFPAVDPSVRGAAQVSFGINPDGSVAWVNILSSTGPPAIRRAAAAQVRRAAPFPPPPEGTSQRMVFTYQRR
ncbi:TonB family protein [Roseovarius autotrophicus]|uniref:TonB family protein n=1 Tax=Roseovarius autotrophicus TaxID=2824121 RepID=UPI001B37A8EF|nr:TonB family protein [Roseovarius autotrophicus]